MSLSVLAIALRRLMTYKQLLTSSRRSREWQALPSPPASPSRFPLPSQRGITRSHTKACQCARYNTVIERRIYMCRINSRNAIIIDDWACRRDDYFSKYIYRYVHIYSFKIEIEAMTIINYCFIPIFIRARNVPTIFRFKYISRIALDAF